MELAEGLAAHTKVGRRAEVDDLYGVVLQIHQYILGLDVAMHNTLGEYGQTNAYELREDLLEYALTEREGLAIGQVEQSHGAVELLHDDDKAGGLLEKVVDFYDARRVTQSE